MRILKNFLKTSLTIQSSVYAFLSVVFLYAWLASVSQLGAVNTEIENLENFHQDLIQLGDRRDGTKGEKQAMNLIVENLQALNIPYRRDSLGDLSPGYSFSENILAIIPGRGEGNILLAAPIDSSAFGMALMLYTASRIKAKTHENGLLLAFLGAEKGLGPYYPYGSRRAQENAKQSGAHTAIYIESEYQPQKWLLQLGGNGSLPPYWITKSITSFLSYYQIPYRLNGVDLLISSSGMQGDIGAASVWIKSGIPVARLGGMPSSEAIEVANAAESFNMFVGSILDSSPPRSNLAEEYKYLFLRMFDLPPLIIPEIIYIPALLIMVGLLLVIILMSYRIVLINLQRFHPYWMLLPVLVIIIFFFLFLSSLIMETLILVTGLPQIWEWEPEIFVLLKMTLASFLSINFVTHISGIHLPNHAHFYSYSAIFTSIILIFVFTAIDINLAIYVIWSSGFLIMMASVKKQRLKMIFLMLSALPHLIGLLLSVYRPYIDVVNFIVFNRIKGNLFLSMILFPVLMGVLSISYRQTERWNFILHLTNFLLSSTLVLSLLWLVNLDVDNITPVFPSISTIPAEASLTLKKSSRPFLGRRTVNIRAESLIPPVTLKLWLRSDKPFTLHSSSFPYQVSSSGSEAEIFVGRHPPFPFELSFTINEEAKLTLDMEANWSSAAQASTAAKETIKHYSLKLDA